jgi:hypothetical protein
MGAEMTDKTISPLPKTIYLVTDSFEGELCFLWCDDDIHDEGNKYILYKNYTALKEQNARLRYTLISILDYLIGIENSAEKNGFHNFSTDIARQIDNIKQALTREEENG